MVVQSSEMPTTALCTDRTQTVSGAVEAYSPTDSSPVTADCEVSYSTPST